jgi:glutamine amidotransferase
MKVVIVDYGSGNLRSAAKAFARAAGEVSSAAVVTLGGDPAALADATHIVLPGVGAFGDCKAGLVAVPGLIAALTERVIARATPFLGICVGMQLLATVGREHGSHEGLGWIAGEVAALRPADPALKIPHMGWNELAFTPGAHPLLDGIAPGDHAYFVHSYGFAAADPSCVAATVDYGGPVTAMVARGNIAGTQFHPEKSQHTGLRLIANFLRWAP